MSNRTDPDAQNTPDDLQEMLNRMEKLSTGFYWIAFEIRNHAFIEFCGLMREYINLCKLALDEGRDFTQANIHTGKPLFTMEEHHAKYLGDKFGCIFGACFAQNWDHIRAFVLEAFGVDIGEQR